MSDILHKYKHKLSLLAKHVKNKYIFCTIYKWGRMFNDTFVKLDSNINIYEMVFLHKIIKASNAKNILEIGCATGVSSMTIVDALGKNMIKGNTEASLHIIDPYQMTQWSGFGIHNAQKIKKMYCKKGHNISVNLIEEKSNEVMVSLNDTYDIIFIDGAHDYENILSDIQNSFNLIKHNGIIILDDVRHTDVCRALKESVNSSWKQIMIKGSSIVPYNKKYKSCHNNPTTMFAYQINKKLKQNK